MRGIGGRRPGGGAENRIPCHDQSQWRWRRKRHPQIGILRRFRQPLPSGWHCPILDWINSLWINWNQLILLTAVDLPICFHWLIFAGSNRSAWFAGIRDEGRRLRTSLGGANFSRSVRQRHLVVRSRLLYPETPSEDHRRGALCHRPSSHFRTDGKGGSTFHYSNQLHHNSDT